MEYKSLAYGIRLRQSYLRVARRARRDAAKLIHPGRPRQAERQVRQLRTWLGRLFRDIGRKIAGNAVAIAAIQAVTAGLLGLVARLLRQRREDRGRDKRYSLHADSDEVSRPLRMKPASCSGLSRTLCGVWRR